MLFWHFMFLLIIKGGFMINELELDDLRHGRTVNYEEEEVEDIGEIDCPLICDICDYKKVCLIFF